jgi:hypothetical protein
MEVQPMTAQTTGIMLQLLGYIGMILFPKKFGFATSLDDYRSMKDKFLGLNGYHFWVISWLLGDSGNNLDIILNPALFPAPPSKCIGHESF